MTDALWILGARADGDGKWLLMDEDVAFIRVRIRTSSSSSSSTAWLAARHSIASHSSPSRDFFQRRPNIRNGADAAAVALSFLAAARLTRRSIVARAGRPPVSRAVDRTRLCSWQLC